MLAARDLDRVAETLRTELGLGDPYADPAVGYFGLRNAVFAAGDTFLEVVSPVRSGTAAGRLLERRGGDCGYMLMFQVEDLAAARSRAHELGVREVFEVSLPDMAEVHLHPADMRGAIVSLSEPRPPESWRWGGPGWEQRSATGKQVTGVRIAVPGTEDVAERWRTVIGDVAAVRFEPSNEDRGLVEIRIASQTAREPVEIAGVRFSFQEDAQ